MGLTQIEVAALLGHETAGNLSRFERASRVPYLEAALTLELVFDARMAELFPLYCNEIADDLLVRIGGVEERLGAGETWRERLAALKLAEMRARLQRQRVSPS